MPRRNGGLTKTQTNKFAQLMAKFGVDENTVQEAAKEALYNEEQAAYEAQAILNFYEARINPEPEKKPGESDKQYQMRKEAAYKEWAFKTCKGCDLRFAYAYNYEGVSYCSLDCLEKALAEIGIKFSRHKDLKRRWGHLHPAVVSSSALQVLEDIYSSENPDAFAAS